MGYEAWIESLLSRPVAHSAISGFDFAQRVDPGAYVQYVLKASAVPTGTDSSLQGKLVPTIKQALARCRSGYNDVICVLPGHTETIDSAWATNLVAGTKIIGVGDATESNAPTLTWNATGSTIAVDVADVTFANLAMITSINNVAEGFGVTGAGFKFLNNYCTVGLAGPLDFTIFIDLEAGSHRALIAGNKIYGVTGAGSVITLSGAAATGHRIIGNDINAVPTHVSTAGLINLTGAVLDLLIANNVLSANLASSTCCIRAADEAAHGVVARNVYRILGTASAATGFIAAGTTNLVLNHFENYVADPNLSGILAPAAT